MSDEIEIKKETIFLVGFILLLVISIPLFLVGIFGNPIEKYKDWSEEKKSKEFCSKWVDWVNDEKIDVDTIIEIIPQECITGVNFWWLLGSSLEI